MGRNADISSKSSFTSNRKRALSASAVGIAFTIAALSGSVAHAESAEAEATPDSEIVVTADKRERSIQDVPISVSAISAEEILSRGINNYSDYLSSVAGVQFNANEPNSQRFSIRGATTDPAVAGSQLQNTVGVYLDDVPLTSLVGAPTLIDVNPVDAERIEVLRGPQGTLYGSASLGGAVNIVTASPSYDGLSGRIAASIATTRFGEASYGGQAMLNAPLVDGKIAARIAATYRRDGGWVDNGTRKDSNRFDEYAVRAKLRFDPTEQLRIDLTGTIQRSHNQDVGSINPALGDYARDPRTPDDRVTQFRFVQARAAYEFTDSLKLTVSGAYAEVESSEVSDLFFYRPTINFYGGILRGPTFNYNSPGGDGQYESFLSKARSVEARLQYDQGIFSAFLGGFYRKETIDYTADILAPGLSSQIGPPLGSIYFPNDLVLRSSTHARNAEKALFGEVALRPGNFEFVAGARVSDNEVAQDFSQIALGNTTVFPIVSKSSQVTPKFVAAYRFDPSHMIYASATRGYRTGFGNRPQLVPFGAPLSTDADTIWSYEVGLKSAWLDNTLMLNISAYHADWKNIQFSVRPPGSPSSFYNNAGAAETEGFEIEAVMRPSKRLTISTAVSVNRSRLTDPGGARGSLGTVLTVGKHLPGTPDFQISNSLEYRAPIGGEDSAYIRVDHRYFGKNFAEIDNLTRQGDYNVLDLRAGVDLGQYQISAFATNLFEGRGVTFRLPTSAAIIPNEQYQIKPRTIGLMASVRF